MRCANCGADATPFKFANGYTIAFDEARRLGVTLPREPAEEIARDAAYYAALPENSVQHPILVFAPHDIVGVVARLRPFMGQLGTSPSIDMPDSHNAGDFGSFLIGAPHDFALTAEQLVEHKTDGHMDVDAVRAGAILICPVKLPGRRRLPRRHARAAGRRRDRRAHVRRVRHGHAAGRGDQGRPRDRRAGAAAACADDLPFLARPLTESERVRARALAARWGVAGVEDSAPISVIGTGPDLNSATDNGLERAATLLDMTVPEVKNRATISGAIEIGRHPGVVQVTFRAPMEALERRGLGDYAREQYEIA